MIGIAYLEAAQARALGIKIPGVLILDVPKGSNAAKAGFEGTKRSGFDLVLGDIITKIDSNVIKDEIDLLKVLEKYQVGDKVTVTVSRSDGSVKDLRLVLSGSSR